MRRVRQRAMSPPESTGRRVRGVSLASAAIAVAAFLTLVGLAAGFGIGTSCTDAYNCTRERCPAACDRIDVAVWANTVGQLVLLGLATAVLIRGRSRTTALALIVLGLSTALAAGSLALASSWR